jgi:hypothetical protein
MMRLPHITHSWQPLQHLLQRLRCDAAAAAQAQAGQAVQRSEACQAGCYWAGQLQVAQAG